jgi:hypothetical protein
VKGYFSKSFPEYLIRFRLLGLAPKVIKRHILNSCLEDFQLASECVEPLLGAHVHSFQK